MIKNADLDWLEIHYPGMVYIPSKNILQGCLWFRMIYYPTEDISVVDPVAAAEGMLAGIFIEDVYEVDVKFNSIQSWAIVEETAGRIQHATRKWGKTLHVYSDNSLCLCPKPEEKLRFPDGFNLREFINELLIPNLFYQSYFEKYGKEPWKGSSHDDLGILESYDKQLFKKVSLDNIVNCYLDSLPPSLVKLIIMGKKINLNLLCPCGLNKKFQNCHESAFSGLQKLSKDYWLVKAGKFHPVRK